MKGSPAISEGQSIVSLLLFILSALCLGLPALTGDRVLVARGNFEDPSTRCAIAIQPLGAFDRASLADLAASLGEVFVCRIRVLESVDLPSAAFYSPRSRYRADRLLPFLSGRGSADAHILGVTAVDISVTKDEYPDWGVFGLANLGGPACVVSTFRLGRRASARHSLRERLLKVSIHELGHTFGLEHCPTASCVMAGYGGSMDTLDASGLSFCSRCRRSLVHMLKPAIPAGSGIRKSDGWR